MHTEWLAQWLALWQYPSDSSYWVISLLRVCVRCILFCRVLSKAGKDILLASVASGILLSRLRAQPLDLSLHLSLTAPPPRLCGLGQDS